MSVQTVLEYNKSIYQKIKMLLNAIIFNASDVSFK